MKYFVKKTSIERFRHSMNQESFLRKLQQTFNITSTPPTRAQLQRSLSILFLDY